MGRWHALQSFLLISLASSLLLAAYAPIAIVVLDGTPNWLDVLILSIWVILAGTRLEPLARPLARRRFVPWLALALMLAALLTLALPWALRVPVDGGLWRIGPDGRYYLDISTLTPLRLLRTLPQTLYVLQDIASGVIRAYQQGAASLATHLQAAGLVLALGLGLTLIVLAWGIVAEAFLASFLTRAEGVLGGRLQRITRPLQNTLAVFRRAEQVLGGVLQREAWLLQGIFITFRRTRAGQIALEAFRWSLIVLLALDGIGVLLVAQPMEVNWKTLTTFGLPSGSLFSVRSLAVGLGGELYAGTSGGVFRSDDGGEHWRPLSGGLTNLNVQTLIVGPAGELYAGTWGGVFRSDDGGEHWRPVNEGLTSLNIQALAVGPGGELFAGTSGFLGNGGVFRSDDGGEHWRPVNEGLTSLNIQALAVGPKGELYAGTNGGGVFRSDDGGEQWRPVNEGLTNLDVRALTVGPGGELYAGTDSGVFRSDDGGEHWRPLNEGLTDLDVHALTVGPGGELYAGTSGGVFRFDDGGERWRLVNEGLTDLDVQALAVGPRGELYAGTSGGGVFRSDDGGGHWRPVNEGLTGLSMRALVVGPGGELYAGTLGGGIFRSDDGGEHWQPVNEGLASGLIVSLIVGPGGELYAGTLGGVFHSDDGEHWRPVGEGLTDPIVWALAVRPGGELYAGTLSSGVFRYDDGGEHWRPVNRGLTNLDVRALTVGLGGELYAGTSGGGIFRSDDGERWQSANEGLTNTYIWALAVGPEGELYAGTANGGVFYSDDSGKRWRPVNEGLTVLGVLSLAVGPKGELYAGTEGGVFRSGDGGADWRPINEGLASPSVFSLAVGPEGELYAGTEVGIFRSDDGEHWQLVSKALASGLILSLIVGPGGELYAGTSGGVFRSDDGGERWRPVNEGLTDLNVQALAMGPGGELYAGTEGGGIFRSDNGGAHWQPVNEGLTDLNVWGLAVDPGGELYAETLSGTFRSDDGGVHWQPVSRTDTVPSGVSFKGIWMNADQGYVYLSRPGMGWLRWAVYNGHAPQAIYVRGHRAILYTLAGVAMLLRAEVPLPLIWNMPTPYLALVAATWRAIEWAAANALPLSIGLGLTVFLFAFYTASVALPNRLRPATVLWLLPHPRHLLAASGYRDYARRWAEGSPLEQLALLLSPAEGPLVPDDMLTVLRRQGALCDEESLRLALEALARRGLLVREDGAWRPAQPMLLPVLRREQGREAPTRLARRTREEHPLYAESRRFLNAAGFSVQEADPSGFLCASPDPLWADISPLYVRLSPGWSLDLEAFRDLCAAARQAYGGSLRGRTALVVIDRPPRAADLHQIFALHAQEGFTVVPLPRSLMTTALLEEREREALREQVDRYVGRADLYDVPGAVTDVLSFFGRSALLADLRRRLTDGRSVFLFGLRKIGKSSLMGRLREEVPWPVAMVDLEGYTSGLSYVYEEAMRGWVAALRLAQPGLELPDLPDWGGLSETGARAQAFRRFVLSLLERMAELPGRPGLLLFLDEMDAVFGRPEYPEFAAVLRSISEDPQCWGRFALVAAGLEPNPNRVDRMGTERNPFYRFFGEVPLGPLDLEDARTMVVSIGGQMGLAYDEDALTLLVEAGGGHPFLTRQLCSRAVRGLERPGRVDGERARRAVEAYLREPRNYMAETLWGVDAGGPPPEEADLLRALAHQQPLPTDALLPPDLPPDQRRRYDLALEHLRDQGIVQEGENGWELAFPLYRRWLRRYVLNLQD